MSPTYSIPPVTHSISFYISVFSQDQLKALLADSPVSHWDVTYPRLLAETRKAVVPISGGYPIEWGIWRQLAGSESVRFTNVCDVVSRDALPSVIIDSRQPAVADTDSLGPYWTLQDGVVRPKIDAPVTGVMEVRYNGPPPHVAISGVVGATAPLTANVDKQAVLRVTGRFDAQSRLTIESDAGTRFRAITFYRFP
jgi:hypothetical protein